jgi:hypothetical protein
LSRSIEARKESEIDDFGEPDLVLDKLKYYATFYDNAVEKRREKWG